MMGLNMPCLDCGELSADSRCEPCRTTHDRAVWREQDRQRGTREKDSEYDSAWARLSIRARKIQMWCSDCGATEDLTTDHKPSAWVRKAAGKAIRLIDVDVLCRRCNSRKGSTKPGSVRAS